MLTCHGAHPNTNGVNGGEKRPLLISQIPNLIGSVITALLIDGYNLWSPLRARGLGPVSLRDNMPHRCGEMMCADSGYSRLAWDTLKETLIDPENRDACGRMVIEPGTDV